MRRSILLALLAVFTLSLAAVAAELPVTTTDAQIAAAVAEAPAPPVELGLDLRWTLVDYIDCTNPADPHPFMDRGTSKVVAGPAGTYRVTAAHRHAYFAYRWRAAGRDVPHVLVVEYPDDAKRTIIFSTHESRLSGKANLDWSLETGVYAGNPLPNTGRMQYHTMFFWPADDWPVVMAANWNRSGAPAAASRIWVYRVDGGLPPLAADEPDADEPRMIGDLYNWAKVPVQGVFGLTDRVKAFDHIAEYYAYLGQNMVSWPVVSNNAWGFKCRIDAWDGDDEQDWLAGVLAACEKRGVKFVATFDIGRGFTIGGKTAKDDPKAYREGLLKGFAQFIERYGASPALYGVAFGTPDFGPPYGDATWDIIGEVFDGDMAAFTTFLHEKAPQLKIYTFVGAQDLHRQYFADAPGVMARWEAAGGSWDEHLADEVSALWKSWKRDPAELAKVPHLTTVYQYQGDDHAIYDSYAQQGRSMIYYDVDTSAPKAARIDTRAVMLWNTFYEGWFGLHPEENFWYRKLWVAPDANAAEPFAGAPWARAMEHRDRNFILAGAWNRKAGGHEGSLRRFAKAYRALPPVEMTDVPVAGGQTVQVRRAVYQGATYVSVLNTTPFEALAAVTLGEKAEPVALAPFELKTFRADGDKAVAVETRIADDYVAWLKSRLDAYGALLAEVRALAPDAAGDAYAAHLRRARKLFADKKYRQTDLALGHGLTAELALRKRILAPPQVNVPRISAVPPADTPAADWPAGATVEATEGSFLGSHLYFSNSWTGPDDLSATVRLAHDGERLYIGLDIRDSKLTDKDSINIMLSPANYRKWLVVGDDKAPYEINIPITLPLDAPTTTDTGGKGLYTAAARRTKTGYTATVAVRLADLKIRDGKLGWIVQIGDHEKAPGTNGSRWAKESILLIPNAPAFAYWSDARSCGQLVLE